MTEATVDRNGLTPQAYLLWIHCNRCFEVYMRKRRRFFLLACQHVACENCATVATVTADFGVGAGYKCPICTKIVRACAMGNMMTQHLKELFHPQPWDEGLHSTRIMRFQCKQRAHFQRGMAQMHKKRDKHKDVFEQQRVLAQKEYADNAKLRRECAHNERRVRLIIQQRQQEAREERKRQEMQRLAKPLRPLTPTSSTIDSSMAPAADSVAGHPPIQRNFLPPAFGRGLPATAPTYGGRGGAIKARSSSLDYTNITNFTHPTHHTSFKF